MDAATGLMARKRRRKKAKQDTQSYVRLAGCAGEKEKVIVAIEKISKGTRILAEEPIITVPRDKPDSEPLRISICRQVDAFSEHQRQAFLSVHNLHAYRDAAEQYLGIVRPNALPAETNGSEGGIFLEGCSINHACDNNAQKNRNRNIKRHTVHALRDIVD